MNVNSLPFWKELPPTPNYPVIRIVGDFVEGDVPFTMTVCKHSFKLRNGSIRLILDVEMNMGGNGDNCGSARGELVLTLCGDEIDERIGQHWLIKLVRANLFNNNFKFDELEGAGFSIDAIRIGKGLFALLDATQEPQP